ncbi:MAG: RnfABCDGE type electron transport complex subunit D [Spirochaetaceae bacterium]
MRRVLYSLVPLFLMAVYLYGWRVLAHAAVVFAAGIITEYIFERKRGKKVSEAVLVTAALFTLSLPPALPVWISVIGIIFAVAVVKEMYGGFGRNIFNPAIGGRLFIWIAFAAPFASAWMEPGGFGSGEAGIDLITAATPLEQMEEGTFPEIWNLLIGTRAGSLGESSILLITIGGLYLIFTKTAQWRLVLSTLLGALILSSALFYTGVSSIPPHFAMLSGSIWFGAFYFATDPITAPNKKSAQWIYGLLIGTITVLVRVFTGFNAGLSFGVFVANVFSSLLDEIMPAPKKKKAVKSDKSGAKLKEAAA